MLDTMTQIARSIQMGSDDDDDDSVIYFWSDLNFQPILLLTNFSNWIILMLNQFSF